MNDAVKLAVMMPEAANIFEKELEKEVEERKMTLLDERGDHITLFSIYTKFSNMKAKTGIAWCKEHGVNHEVLRRVRKSIDNVFQTLKANRVYDILPKKRKMNQEDTDLDKLCQAIVIGYFHNTAEPNDTELQKSGYSMLTPRNYGQQLAGGRDVELLKLRSKKHSSLSLHGDNTRNTYIIFEILWRNDSKDHVYIQTETKIKADWIQKYASKTWQKSVGLNFNQDTKTLRTFVRRICIKHVGPRISTSLLEKNAENETKKFLIEKTSNAKIEVLIQKNEIRLYGSIKELTKAFSSIYELILVKIKEFRSQKVYAYKSDTNINAVLTINSSNVQPIRFIKEYSFNNKVVVFDKISLFHHETLEEDITALIDELNGTGAELVSNTNTGILNSVDMSNTADTDISNDTKAEAMRKTDMDTTLDWDSYTVLYKNKGMIKIEFSSEKVANYIVESLRERLDDKGFGVSACCFIDRHFVLRVQATNLYPEFYRKVKELGFEIKRHRSSFHIVIKDVTKEQQFRLELEEFAKERYFASRMICRFKKEKLFSIESIQEILRGKLKQWIHECERDYNCKIKYRKLPRLQIEIR